MAVRHIPCGAPVNASEERAIEKLKNSLQSLPGEWVLLSNLSHSAHSSRLSDEIDQVIVGPSGVFVVEVKHWDLAWIRKNLATAEAEAERIADKARRVAGKVRGTIASGFIPPRFLLTRSGTGMQAGQRFRLRGVEAFGLGEWRDLVDAGAAEGISNEQVRRVALLLEPAARLALTGDLRSFAGFVNLERLPTEDAPFHRAYRGLHSTRRDKVILHLYDLSASDDKDAENRARREYDVLQRWQKSPYLPSLLDSFQEAERYPGELYWFSIVDPVAPTLAERSADADWPTDPRLRYAREALLALASFHEPDEAQPPVIHRRITPQRLRVRHNGRPLFTDFSLARLADSQTISLVPVDFGDDARYVAPEVRARGLAVADLRSDTYGLCASLKELFTGDDQRVQEARGYLELGCAENPAERPGLRELAAVLERNTLASGATAPQLPDPRYWDEDTIVPFKNSRYKIIGRLGCGGIGETFKVVEVDQHSDECYGTYVAKLIRQEADANVALPAYRKARAYTTVDPHLSAIHEIAPEWRPDRFAALLKWIEGQPLADLTGKLAAYAEEIGEADLQAMLLRWLRDLCSGLSALHQVSLVHGDVSPRNIVVQGGEVVLTDYDTVSEVGRPARTRNPVYASRAVEVGDPADPSDDVFALAAGFFHVLFDCSPFDFGGVRCKQRGLNREAIDTSGLEGVMAFLERATHPQPEQRLADSRSAIALLDTLRPRSDAVQAEPAAGAPVLGDNVAPRLAELLSAYPGSRHGNTETRGLDSDFAAATYVETRLDRQLRHEIERGEVKLAILFGNAGDGKTAFLQHLLAELGSPSGPSSQRIQKRRLGDGLTLLVNLDGSAAWEGRSANGLLDEFFRPCHELNFDGLARHPRLLAINSGKLLEWLEQQDEGTPLTKQLDRSLFSGEDEDEAVLDPRIRLIDLNRRSLVGGISAGGLRSDFLNELLDRFVGERAKDPWHDCVSCTAQPRCTAWHSVQVLRDPHRGQQLRARLADALQACHLRGEIHITARELRAALVFILFGVHDCAELHDDLELRPPRYWDRAFAADAPQRQGELLGELAGFDPALDSSPLVDRLLLRNIDRASPDLAGALESERRRAWFEWDAERLQTEHLPPNSLTLFGGSHLDRFRSVPLLDDEQRAALCRELCLGIARLEDLPEVAFRSERGLPLRIQPKTPTETCFWVIKPWARFRLEAHLPQTSEHLEVLHTHLLLTYRYAGGGEERLPIGLELFHLLLGLSLGNQLAGAGQEGVFAHLEIFTQRLAQEDARELHGCHPGEPKAVFRVRVEHRGGRQVLVREEAA